MIISGWGQYPIVDAQCIQTQAPYQLASKLQNFPHTIARGLGRSYGDSALAESVCLTTQWDHVLAFDAQTGILEAEAGISLNRILEIFVPLGWFLAVTPGTQWVTLGGAIASDVHGKNHHHTGTFCNFVYALSLLTPDGIKNCTSTQNAELFSATCGGMGLTGIITKATIQLIRIPSAMIDQTIIKTPNLDATLDAFEIHANSTYSVAWIDCLAKGQNMGRSLVMLGEHSLSGALQAAKPAKLTLPFHLPNFCLNAWSIGAFNQLYYHRVRQDRIENTVHYGPFFYPLDAINHWNRLYGRAGFVQYQFVIPKQAGIVPLKRILTEIAQAQTGSFLAVLKTFGAKQSPGLLSFPMAGYTLALDFKLNADTLSLLNHLDQMIAFEGGRLYLTKDARQSQTNFQKTYPKWENLSELREKLGLRQFESFQSKRLGLY
jgi:decaprenylphospho-beta-D-ribofuranose 2-oxidase